MFTGVFGSLGAQTVCFNGLENSQTGSDFEGFFLGESTLAEPLKDGTVHYTLSTVC